MIFRTTISNSYIVVLLDESSLVLCACWLELAVEHLHQESWDVVVLVVNIELECLTEIRESSVELLV